ncbi:hypothetical protein GCM10018787_22380 [Streptomyces thermodiastaticus]|nr:hypothetical protein GCM10018787_22380 [Streptomyces thermodiastaticus]
MCRRRCEEAGGLPVDAGRHRYSLPPGRGPFRPFDSATAAPSRSATLRYRSGYDGGPARTAGARDGSAPSDGRPASTAVRSGPAAGVRRGAGHVRTWPRPGRDGAGGTGTGTETRAHARRNEKSRPLGGDGIRPWS